MATNLRVDFTISGFLDGPVAQKLLDEGKTADDFADMMARELKAIVTEEIELAGDERYRHQVNAHVTARLHEADTVGEASSE